MIQADSQSSDSQPIALPDSLPISLDSLPVKLNVLAREFMGNDVQAWLLALAGFVLGFATVFAVRSFLLSRFADRAERTENQVDDFIVEVLRRTRFFLASIVGLVVASRFVVFSERVLAWEGRLLAILFIVQVGLWGNAILNFWLSRYTKERVTVDAGSVTTIRAIVLVAKLVLWSLLFLVALQTFGIDVTALVAGLGIGGVAVALAVQSVLGDLLASLSIALDKPFVIGDFIIVDGMPGTIEQIGLRTTRVRALSGEQLIFSNTDLLKARIRNFKRMAERRIAFQIGVEYGTPPEVLEGAPQLVREIIEPIPNTRFDRAHFFAFGDSSLTFEIVYWVLSPDYAMYMDIQQQINFAIFRRFQEAGMSFAFPTRTLHVRGDAPDGSVRALVRGANGDGAGRGGVPRTELVAGE